MKTIVMFKTTGEDYKKFIINLGIIPSLILLKKFEDLELYEECEKILEAVKLLNKKAVVYKETKLTDELISQVVDDYQKMGMEEMDKEKLLIRAEKHASSFISSNSYIIYKEKK